MATRAGEARLIPLEIRQSPGAWFPCRLDFRGDHAAAEWCWLGNNRFTNPFFEDTVRLCRAAALGRGRLRTPLRTVLDVARGVTGLPLAGLIFHMSRCGSTLLAGQLRVVPGTVVLSEPAPVDDVLRAVGPGGPGDAAERVEWLRAVATVLGQRRDPVDQRLVLKLDCWSIFHLPVLEQAFPGVPWVFLYRDPVEVLVSHARMPGRQMVPDLVPPGLFGLEDAWREGRPPDEYPARVLGALLNRAEEAVRTRSGGGRLVHYSELPEAAISVAATFGIPVDVDAQARMLAVAAVDAKQPQFPFSDDRPGKRASATPRQQDLCRTYAQPAYERLEALREQQQKVRSRYTQDSTAPIGNH